MTDLTKIHTECCHGDLLECADDRVKNLQYALWELNMLQLVELVCLLSLVIADSGLLSSMILTNFSKVCHILFNDLVSKYLHLIWWECL